MKKKHSITEAEMSAAFEAWDTEYREYPGRFESTVDHLLRNTPAEYGPRAAVCFLAYIEKNRTA